MSRAESRAFRLRVAGCSARLEQGRIRADGTDRVLDPRPLRGLERELLAGRFAVDEEARPVRSDPRRQYLGHGDAASWTFRLPQGNKGDRLEVGDVFEVDVIDTWNMSVSPVGRTFTLTDVQRNDAFAENDAAVALPGGSGPFALRITRVE